jgi:hypothetical protein
MDGEITEYALPTEAGFMAVRIPAGTERLYPAERWVRDQQALGQRVLRRRIIVVEDWAEVDEQSG